MKKKDKDKITLKELWSHPFYNSLIKLGLWFLFFAVLYFFLMIGSINSPKRNTLKPENDKTEKTISFIEMKNNLINNNQKIVYSINNYYIAGIISDNTLTGTLEDNFDHLIKIKYDGDKLYQLKKEEEIENNDILDNLKKEYLLPSKIIEIIDNPNVIGTKSADELSYSYTIDNIAISFYLNTKQIEKIIILDNDITYNLEYEEVVNEK